MNNLLKYYGGCNLCEDIESSVDRVKFNWDFLQLTESDFSLSDLNIIVSNGWNLKMVLWVRTERRSGEQNPVRLWMCSLSIWGISKNFKHVKTTTYTGSWRHNWKFPRRFIEIELNILNLPTASLCIRFSRTVRFWKQICSNVKFISSEFFLPININSTFSLCVFWIFLLKKWSYSGRAINQTPWFWDMVFVLYYIDFW